MTETVKEKTPLKKLHEAFIKMFNREDMQVTYRKCANHKRAALLAGKFFTEHGEPISLSWVSRVMREAAGNKAEEEEQQQETEVEKVA